MVTRGGVFEKTLITFEVRAEIFESRLKAYLVNDTPEQRSRSIRMTTASILRRVIRRTLRVDTGRMKNGWFESYHARNRSSRPPFVPPGSRSVWDPPDPGSPFNLSVAYIQNNVEYAPFHEFGTEKIAPLRMLAISLQEVTGELSRALGEGIRVSWNKRLGGVGSSFDIRGTTSAALGASETARLVRESLG